jgi:serine-type D-Ala-D-Ala carboxypeptidase/endopeptidase (penicillin-binding protein 4)
MLDLRARQPRLRRTALALPAALLIALAPGAPAQGSAPDHAFQTPVARGGAQAHSALAAPQLQAGLRRQLRRGGGAGGAFVSDPTSGAVLFSRGASRAFQIASNMKLFTTATALERIGPAEQLETTLVAPGGFAGGVVQGDLVLRGGGDPTLSRAGLAKLAAEARARGLSGVSGRLLYDESLFDRRRAVPQKGISGGPFGDVGRLSGLAFEGGRSRDPARAAALAMVAILRKQGVSVPKRTGRGFAPAALPPENLVADVGSPPLSTVARTTNTFSVNFYAEMLLKAIAAEVSGRGTTAAGAGIVRAFAAQAGGSLRTQNGSGLSRADLASPRSVGALLASMLKEEEPVRAAFLNSLAIAGGTGTLARRMRGTAAQGRCIGKTGTLTGVSALSGYCEVAPERFVVFSILMNRVDVGRAHFAQDRMVALIARYTP